MDIIDIINIKKTAKELNKEQIKFFVDEYTKGNIKDYQASALLMAIRINGLTNFESYEFTKCMLETGTNVDLSVVQGKTADKHSTGGVGDKTSLVLIPVLAACGLKMAKLSGRGLGQTGGTIDKLESIPGFRTDLSEDEFINQVNNIGLAINGQTKSLVPADKKLYALRDVTGTVDSIPLIASSIMSKKLAVSTDCILLDVTTGSGAFMSNMKDAIKLSQLMVEIGKKFNRNVRVVITDMDEPLGYAIGNSLEVIEAVDTLHGHGPKDLEELTLTCAALLLNQAQICNTYKEAYNLAKEKINNGEAFKYFVKMVEAQGGDSSYVLNSSLFVQSRNKIDVVSPMDGYISKINVYAIGILSMRLGAGRENLDDIIDTSAGIMFHKKIGDKIIKGETIATLYTNKDIDESYRNMVIKNVVITKHKVRKIKLIKKVVY